MSMGMRTYFCAQMEVSVGAAAAAEVVAAATALAPARRRAVVVLVKRIFSFLVSDSFPSLWVFEVYLLTSNVHDEEGY